MTRTRIVIKCQHTTSHTHPNTKYSCSTSSSSVAYVPAMAEKGVAMASKVGCHSRRTKSTTAAGDSYYWCSLMTTSLSPAAAAVSSQRLSPRRPPDLVTQGSEVRRLLEPHGACLATAVAGQGELKRTSQSQDDGARAERA